MRCDYKDNFKVDYSDSLHITKGDGIDFTVRWEDIPADVKTSLDSAVSSNSCHELRAAARSCTSSLIREFDIE